MQNLRIKWQLGIGFTAVIALFVATLAVVGVLLSRLIGGVETIDDQTLPFVLTVDEMDLSRSDVQQFLTDVSATHDPDGYKDAEASAQRFQGDVEKFRTRYKADGDSEGLRQLDSLEADFHHFYDLGKTMAAAYVSQGMEAGNQLMKGTDSQPGFDAASDALLEKMRGFRKRQVDEAHQITTEARRSAVLTRDWMLGGSLVSMLLAAILGGWIVRNILRQLGGELHEAVELARRVAQGHLQTTIKVPPGDSESLMAQLQSMQESLSQIVGQVREGAESVASASAQIAQGNHDLSTRTAHQASGLEETAASTEQLGATVKQNADNAREANQVAMHAAEVAENGGALVGQVVNTMKGINDSSRKIADIIGVIDGIAFQTNILALNAAVEAARAGEQGRGFAVVASEVRSLAGRSAEAAKQIKSLITDSVERVEQGSALVDRAGTTMHDIVEAIRRVSQIMGEITTASAEQTLGVTQVSDAVSLMDQGTQQNAALVEEMAAAADSLQIQAQGLVQGVAVFQLRTQSARHPGRTAALPAPAA